MKTSLCFFLFLLYLQTGFSAIPAICWNITDNIYCFNDNTSFINHEYFQEPKETILKTLNLYLEDLNEGANKFQVNSVNEELVLLVYNREIVKKEESIMKLKIHKTINSDMFEEEMYKNSTKIIEDYQKIPDLMKMNAEMKLALALLHHCYYIEQSPFKAWLRAMPLVHIPYFSTVTEEVLSLLEGDHAHKIILSYREKMMNDYEKTIEIINSWPFDIKTKILNNRETITINDWIFAYLIVLKQSWNMYDVLYLVPGVNFASYNFSYNPTGDLNDFKYSFLETHKLTHDKFVYLLAHSDILFGDQMTDSFGRFLYANSLFLYNSKIHNPTECVEVEMVEKEVYEALDDSEKELLRAAGIFSNSVCYMDHKYSFKGFEVFGNVMNMNVYDAKNCFDMLMQNPITSTNERISFILKKCKNPLWVLSEDIEEDEIVKDIKKIIKSYKDRIQKSEHLIERKENENDHVGLVKFYFEEKVGIAEKLEIYVRGVIKKQLKRAQKTANTMKSDL